LKGALKLLAFLYIYFNKLYLAVATLENLRDVAKDDHDYTMVMFAYK
jgi:hypothetical protein